jgi:hypothetical protein
MGRGARMTKRAYGKFARSPADDYATPRSALEPLLPFLDKAVPIIEPCPGDGRLHSLLERAGFIVTSHARDARDEQYPDPRIFVTNPPWSRELLHPIIENLSNQAPTWLLFDADWAHTAQSIPYLLRLTDIVSIGRVKWMPSSESVGYDNACWYRFGLPRMSGLDEIIFHGRKKLL